jgi:hypothetical protein
VRRLHAVLTRSRLARCIPRRPADITKHRS